MRRPKQIGAVPVKWFLIKGAWDFGYAINYSAGLPIYVTDLERTLLDAMRAPGDAGGVAVVLRAWRNARTALDLERLVGYTDRVGLSILRQRVGFLLETLGLGRRRSPMRL